MAVTTGLTLTTTAGDLDLPKLRTGSFFPVCSSAAAGWMRRCSRW
jgi:hypothetical protein